MEAKNVANKAVQSVGGRKDMMGFGGFTISAAMWGDREDALTQEQLCPSICRGRAAIPKLLPRAAVHPVIGYGLADLVATDNKSCIVRIASS